MSKKHDTNVTVHINGIRYRGAYKLQDDQIVVSGCGLRDTTNDLSVLAGETGKAAMNLAKLMLVQMVRSTMDRRGCEPGLYVQGTTTQIFC